MRTYGICSGVAQPLALTSDEFTHLRMYGGGCSQHVSTAYRPVVRGVNAHQVTQTRASSTLRKWGTQDSNLALLAIQQGGPRERIPYPRPLEYDARAAWRPRFRGPNEGPDAMATVHIMPRDVVERWADGLWQLTSCMWHSENEFLSSRGNRARTVTRSEYKERGKKKRATVQFKVKVYRQIATES